MVYSLKGIQNISPRNLFLPANLAVKSVKFNGRDFYVIDKHFKPIKVERHNISKDLRGISAEQLEKCLKVAYISLRNSGNTFALDLNPRLKGGNNTCDNFLGTVGLCLVGIGVLSEFPITGTIATVVLIAAYFKTRPTQENLSSDIKSDSGKRNPKENADTIPEDILKAIFAE